MALSSTRDARQGTSTTRPILTASDAQIEIQDSIPLNFAFAVAIRRTVGLNGDSEEPKGSVSVSHGVRRSPVKCEKITAEIVEKNVLAGNN